ncbi:MAG: Holliday junction branch migration protein RuvA [Chloroflexi bacterium]|nr:MAG: Holliday junction branch migration protein RuvA [Chloroflexota bacterium]
MIASVNGKVNQITANSIIVEMGGVGFQVFVPSQLRDSLRHGEMVFLFTQLIVREDLLALYGFETSEEKDIFIMLLGVDGVGPKLALSVLSTLSPDAIRRAIFNEQSDVFNRVPGVGKRTAQKIMLYLQDKIPAAEGLGLSMPVSDVDTEVLAALTTLGYSVVEAQAALQAIPRDTPQDIEERLRLALKYFSS